MPYKSEKIKLNELQDRRVKLTNAQKEEIKEIYSKGGIGMRPLAKEYGVSRSLIAIIVNPDRAASVKERGKKHWKDYQGTKEEHALAMKKTRRYKQELYIKGELDV